MNIKETAMWRWLKIQKRAFLCTVAPKYCMKKIYRHSFGVELNLDNPRSINEKMQWLKLYRYNDDPMIARCSDKYAVREYLEERGMGYLLPELIGIYDSPEQIDWDKLPNAFAVKCTHGSAMNIIVPDKSKLDIEEAVGNLKSWVKIDISKILGEKWYRYIPHRILIEQYLGNVNTYKIFCFNGEPKVIRCITNGKDGKYGEYLDTFNVDWNRYDWKFRDHGFSEVPPKRPEHLDEMLEISEKLAKDFPFVRVDLYDVEGKIYFSELTFASDGGFGHMEPEEANIIMGDMLDLSNMQRQKK